MKSYIIPFLIFFGKYFAFGKLDVMKQCMGDMCIPRVVWSHWDSNSFPEDVEEMIDVSRKSLANFTYYLLTPPNISNFLNLSSFPKGLCNVHLAGKADYIRACVLEKYGGLYIDSTTYINSGVEMESLFWQALRANRSVFGFAKQRVPMEFLIELNFYGAYEGSFFMKKYKEEYDAALEGNIQRYIVETNKRLKKRKVNVVAECYADYFLVNSVFLRVCVDNASMAEDVFMFPTNSTQYQLANECEWKGSCIRLRLLYDPIARAYPFIKVSARQRLSNRKRFHLTDNSEYWKKRMNRHARNKKNLEAAKLKNQQPPQMKKEYLGYPKTYETQDYKSSTVRRRKKKS